MLNSIVVRMPHPRTVKFSYYLGKFVLPFRFNSRGQRTSQNGSSHKPYFRVYTLNLETRALRPSAARLSSSTVREVSRMVAAISSVAAAFCSAMPESWSTKPTTAVPLRLCSLLWPPMVRMSSPLDLMASWMLRRPWPAAPTLRMGLPGSHSLLLRLNRWFWPCR